MNPLKGEASIKYDGKDIGMIFNNYSLMLFCEEMDCAISEVGDVLNGKKKMRAIFTYVWCGIETYCKHYNLKNEYSIVFASEMFNNINEEESSKLISTIETSLDGDDEPSNSGSSKKK